MPLFVAVWISLKQTLKLSNYSKIKITRKNGTAKKKSVNPDNKMTLLQYFFPGI